MSNIHTDEAWEMIWDNIDAHIDNYFEDHPEELDNFIYSNDKVRKALWESIAQSKLGDKIAQEVFNELPDGPEFEHD